MEYRSFSTFLAALLLTAPLQSIAQARSCSANQQIGISGSNYFPVVAYNSTFDTAQILTASSAASGMDEIFARSAGLDGVFGTNDDIVTQITNSAVIAGNKRPIAYDKDTLLFTALPNGELGRISAGNDHIFGTLDDGAVVKIADIGAGNGDVKIKDNLVGFITTKIIPGSSQQIRTVNGCDLNLPITATGACTASKIVSFTLPATLNGLDIDTILPERLGTAAVISVSLGTLNSTPPFTSTLGLQIPTGAIVNVGAADVQVFGSDSVNGTRLTRKFINSPFAVPARQTLLESRTLQGAATPLQSGNIRIEAVGTEQDNFHSQLPYVYSQSLSGSFDTYMYDIANQHAPIQIEEGASLTDISVGGPFVAYMDQNQRVIVRRCR
jgi:hypothetical protein